MTNLQMFPEHDSEDNDTPFPFLVAKRFNFPLAYHESGDEIYYAIQDWIRGLTGTKNIRVLWGQFKRQDYGKEISKRVRKMSYQALDGKVYQREFTTGQNLLLIMQHLRLLKSRVVLESARYMFAHWLAERTQTRSTSADSLLPDELFDVALEGFHDYGLTDEQIINRAQSILMRPHFLDHFQGRTKDAILPQYYDLITEDIYKGLWGRTPARLKLELGAPTISSVASRMPMMSRSYHSIVEESVLQFLAKEQSLWWADIHFTVKLMVKSVRKHVLEMSKILQMDIATGRPLLMGG